MKKNIVEITADGKQEIVPGSEPLKKKPKKRFYKSARDQWQDLKKKLDNSTAILPMVDDEQEQPEGQPAEQEPQQSEGSDQQSGQISPEEAAQLHPEAQQEGAGGSEEGGDAQESNPEQGEAELEDALKQMGYSDAEIKHIVHGHVLPPPDLDAAKVDNENLTGQLEAKKLTEDAEKDRQLKENEAQIKHEHMKRMNDVAYKDAEEKKAKNKLDIDHHKRMLDLEYDKAKRESSESDPKNDHAKKMNEVEYSEAKDKMGTNKIEQDHKKKMLDLEYQVAKQEKALELEFKKREHELKLEQMEEQLQQQAKQKDEISGIKHKMKVSEAKKPAPKKPLRKSDDAHRDSGDDHTDMNLSEEEASDLEKALGEVNVVGGAKSVNSVGSGWAFNPKSGDFSHDEHGNINTTKTPEGSYEVKHAGKVIGSYPDVGSAGAKIKNYIGTFGRNVVGQGGVKL